MLLLLSKEFLIKLDQATFSNISTKKNKQFKGPTKGWDKTKMFQKYFFIYNFVTSQIWFEINIITVKLKMMPNWVFYDSHICRKTRRSRKRLFEENVLELQIGNSSKTLSTCEICIQGVPSAHGQKGTETFFGLNKGHINSKKKFRSFSVKIIFLYCWRRKLGHFFFQILGERYYWF